MIQIQSYESVNGLNFGASATDAQRVFGPPRNRRVRTGDVLELFYEDMKLSFRGNELCEFTVANGVEVSINNARLAWTPEYLMRLIKHEPTPFESYGIVILFSLGITVTGYHEGEESDRTVTAFRRGLWDPHRATLKLLTL